MKRKRKEGDIVLVVDDWQEEEDKDESDHTVSVIPLRLIWVYVVV